MVGSWVSQDEETGLVEGSLKLVSEGTGSVPSSNGINPSVLSKLEDSPLPIWPSRLDDNVLGILNSHNNPSS